MSKEKDPYEVAYKRERDARLHAEKLLEDKARELYLKNQQLEESFSQLKKQQAIMLNHEKLATLGTLSAGIAHEINNPLAFVSSNIESLQLYLKSYDRLYQHCKQILDKLPESAQLQLSELLKNEDLEYITDDIPELVADTNEGLKRVTEIILNLRSFARTQTSDRCSSDLVAGIESTLKLLNSELKGHVCIRKNLDPIPEITCNPNELNQVFLNLIINAKHATQEISNPTITLSTRVEGQNVIVEISDNGCGMSEELQKEVFVPFFTTKPVGKGTGMGLAIVYSIIQDHQGEILISSEENQGTTFTIKLPIDSI
ncbi:MAG: GHKL domain-containing protein [Neptuniibacter sp.]|nr:GHKL domain-containing protein [Neptuniibacter sp.]